MILLNSMLRDSIFLSNARDCIQQIFKPPQPDIQRVRKPSLLALDHLRDAISAFD